MPLPLQLLSLFIIHKARRVTMSNSRKKPACWTADHDIFAQYCNAVEDEINRDTLVQYSIHRSTKLPLIPDRQFKEYLRVKCSNLRRDQLKFVAGQTTSYKPLPLGFDITEDVIYPNSIVNPITESESQQQISLHFGVFS